MNSKSDYAYQTIKKKILTGEIAPLSDISEEKLQEELQVSRTPIREAIQRLGKEGFVYIYARKGMIVSGIDLEIIRSVYEARLLNEPYLSREVCDDVQEEWLLRMKDAFSNSSLGMREAGFRDYYINLDNELHSTILNHCKNKFLKDALSIVCDHSHRIRIITSRRNEDYNRSIKEHLAILDAFLERNPGKVEETTRVHIELAQQDAFKYNLG